MDRIPSPCHHVRLHHNSPVHLQVSAREYLETALMPALGSGMGVEAKNQVRWWSSVH